MNATLARLLPAPERTVNIAARAAFLTTVVIVGASLMVWGGLGFPALPISFVRGPLGAIEMALIATTYAGIGAFLARRLPGHLVGWSLIVIGVGIALHLPASLLIDRAISAFRPVPPELLVFGWALSSVVVPGTVALLAFLLMVLPDGHLPSRRWRRGAWVTFAGFVLLVAGTALDPAGLVWFPTLPNPIPVPQSAKPALEAVSLAGVVLSLTGLGLGAVCLVRRYRAGDARLRSQLRWIAGGAVFWVTALAPLLLVRYVLGASDAIGTATVHVAAIGALAVPITVFVATTRHHLFGVDAIVTRTLVYVPLMAICGGIYTASVVLSQRLFVQITGNTSDIAIIVATLLMAAAFTPARRALEGTVERVMAKARSAASRTTLADPIEQAGLLSSKLAELETRLASLETPPVRDSGIVVGEPGVGRSFGAGSGGSTANG
ncbi:MAG TPA: hypothetical protein VFX65_03915 [Candidatus Limnocylindrales bacterium]|nr:hypothetical protein [Candidatus Limnocylindrales bacterium]